MSINPESSVGELVSERPARCEVFQSFKIDFCCGGGKSLVQACREAGCDQAEVVFALEASDSKADENPNPDARDWRSATLTELTRHIEATHHEFMKEALPRIITNLAKVREAHGRNHPELDEVARVFGILKAEIEGHLAKEEEILFPMIQEMEATRSAGNAHCGSVNNPIRVMEMEHDNAGEALRRLRMLTGDYSVPSDGCATFQSLYRDLEAMEHDLHIHIHKENNILHPRAAKLEASLLGGSGNGSSRELKG